MSSDLPQGWEEKELSLLTDKIGSGSTPRGGSNVYLDQGEISLIRSQNIYNLEFSKNGLVFITNEAATKLSNVELRENDVLINITGDSVARVCIVPNNYLPARVNQHVSILRTNKEKLDSKYLQYYLVESKMQNQLLNLSSSGATRKALTKTILEKLSITFPTDINKQKRIADILSAFDDKIEINNQMNQTLEDIATALFKEWFENFNFPNDEGKAYKDNGGKMKPSELGEIPIDWEVCHIGDCIDILGGGTPSTRNESYWVGGDINWFSPTDLTRDKTMYYSKSSKKINTIGLKNSSAKEFPPYSLMMTSRATIGVIGINTETATTNQGFITLLPNEIFSLPYLYFWLYSKLDEIHSLSSGSTFKEISKREFKKLKILKFDKKLLDLFENKLNPVFEKIENNQKENESLKKLRDELLPQLISGKKRVLNV